jgi:hypothetical protein
MMAHDSSAPRPDLSASTIAALKQSLGKVLSNPSDTSGLDDALRVLTAEAREKNVHAEQLLVVLKDVWFGLPAIRATPSGESQSALLQRVITQCIREYYAG